MRTIQPLSFLVVAFTALAAEDEAPNLCGGCWCINGTEACPDFGPGVHNTFSPALVQALNSFEPTGTGLEAFQLKSADGGECNPLTQLPAACVPPEIPGTGTPETVSCAMQFVDGPLRDKSCCGRKYKLVNHVDQNGANAMEPLEGDKIIIHRGHCGVCSTAQDMVISATKKSVKGVDIQMQSTLCGIAYNGALIAKSEEAFENLIKCLEDDMGYTPECAKLWAHSIAVTTTTCAEPCLRLQNAPLSGDPPTCELNECMTCNEDASGQSFGMYSGQVAFLSGFTEPMPRPCRQIARVLHDYCDGTLPAEGTCNQTEELQTTPATSVASSTSAFFAPVFILSSYFVSLQLRF